MMIVLQLASEHDTERLGAVMAEALPSRAVIALSGTLGAGKTRLVQALAAAVGVDRADVVSPTFVLCQQYRGRRLIYHIDAYRIRDEDEWFELGVDELVAQDAWIIIEWADRFAEWLPEERLEVELIVTGATAREVRLSGAASMLSAIEKEWSRQAL